MTGKYRQRDVQCPVCGGMFQPTAAGKLPPHLDRRARGRSGYYDDCKGIGKKPA
jgi:hypothetical protein